MPTDPRHLPLIEHHGERAAIEVAERAARKHSVGGQEGAHVWWAIMLAVEKIQNMKPEGQVQ